MTIPNDSLLRSESNWLGYYLYFAAEYPSVGRTNAFLNTVLFDCNNNIFQSQVSTRTWFIRYSFGDKKGFHIRYRILANDGTSGSDVRAIIEDCTKQWSEEVKIVDEVYEPEYDRYGGRVGMEISYRQFVESSKFVLSLVKNSTFRSYDELLFIACMAQMSLVMSVCQNIADVIELTKRISHIAYGQPPDETFPGSDEWRQRFESLYEYQSPLLLKSGEVIWDSVYNSPLIVNEWTKYQKANSELSKELVRANSENLLSVHEKLHSFGFANPILAILASWCHMLNNRLGLLNVDEPLVSYCVNRIVHEIANV